MNMKFPINIVKEVKNAGKTTLAERLSLIIFIALLINVLIYSQIAPIAKSAGVSILLVILAQLILTIIISLTAFRIFVVREEDKKLEFEHSKDPSFSNYYYILDKENVRRLDTVPVHEYSDGNFFILIKFKYGDAPLRSSFATREMYEKLFNDCGKRNLIVRTFNMPEKFKDSVEYANILSSLSNIQSPSIAKVMREIITYNLDSNENTVGLMETTISVQTKFLYQIQDLQVVINNLMNSYKLKTNSVRTIEFLDTRKMKSFLRDYNCLEALDLSSLKTVEVNRELLMKSRNLISIAELNLITGEIITKIEEDSLVRCQSRRI